MKAKTEAARKGFTMVTFRLIFSSLILLLFLASNTRTTTKASLVPIAANGSSSAVEENPEIPSLVPQIEEGKVDMRMMMMMNESRRKLGSFQICALCTCCGGAKRACLASPCCYAINCNIPNRPFGFCSFTPKTCNCIGCHI